MARTRRVFRFTIGQGMAAIAALAVTFAFVPMPAAIFLILFIVLLELHSLVVALRTQRSSPRLGETIGCLSFCAGFLGGASLGAILESRVAAFSGLGIVVALWCATLGALVAGIVGYFFALTLPVPVRRLLSPTQTVARATLEATQAEIELVARLLAQPAVQSDEEIRTKLATYHAKLLRGLSSEIAANARK